MTSAQMLGHRVDPAKCCEVSLEPTTYDYADSSGSTLYECIKLHLCPICGEHGTSSTIWDMQTTFFYCRDRAHIFELDEDSKAVDRIGR